MQTNILWAGREYHSLENCLIDTGETGSEITATIVGSYQGKIYQVTYHIKTNDHWETRFVAITSRHSNETQTIRLEGDGKGNWTLDGKEAAQFNGCIDIDISLTPFTNTLPIRRLRLHQHQEEDIQVIYCDLMERRILPVRQRYRRLSATEYRYQNIPNDFEADIVVDESGFVVDYPTLFVRSAAIKTAYGTSIDKQL
ncbi:putative glycolipid-binding domain-containing protein [Longitalea luteola]|uniref:putative glycolipid-binding domain-containing protein n=1 Tax=Longitalea luteola TaxID=2812563 RepID=UPI001A9743EB|nr:putative glycolipid-binding domain-containing protein [Longitalea luteola]